MSRKYRNLRRTGGVLPPTRTTSNVGLVVWLALVGSLVASCAGGSLWPMAAGFAAFGAYYLWARAMDRR